MNESKEDRPSSSAFEGRRRQEQRRRHERTVALQLREERSRRRSLLVKSNNNGRNFTVNHNKKSKSATADGNETSTTCGTTTDEDNAHGIPSSCRIRTSPALSWTTHQPQIPAASAASAAPGADAGGSPGAASGGADAGADAGGADAGGSHSAAGAPSQVQVFQPQRNISSTAKESSFLMTTKDVSKQKPKLLLANNNNIDSIGNSSITNAANKQEGIEKYFPSDADKSTASHHPRASHRNQTIRRTATNSKAKLLTKPQKHSLSLVSSLPKMPTHNTHMPTTTQTPPPPKTTLTLTNATLQQSQNAQMTHSSLSIPSTSPPPPPKQSPTNINTTTTTRRALSPVISIPRRQPPTINRNQIPKRKVFKSPYASDLIPKTTKNPKITSNHNPDYPLRSTLPHHDDHHKSTFHSISINHHHANILRTNNDSSSSASLSSSLSSSSSSSSRDFSKLLTNLSSQTTLMDLVKSQGGVRGTKPKILEPLETRATIAAQNRRHTALRKLASKQHQHQHQHRRTVSLDTATKYNQKHGTASDCSPKHPPDINVSLSSMAGHLFSISNGGHSPNNHEQQTHDDVYQRVIKQNANTQYDLPTPHPHAIQRHRIPPSSSSRQLRPSSSPHQRHLTLTAPFYHSSPNPQTRENQPNKAAQLLTFSQNQPNSPKSSSSSSIPSLSQISQNSEEIRFENEPIHSTSSSTPICPRHAWRTPVSNIDTTSNNPTSTIQQAGPGTLSSKGSDRFQNEPPLIPFTNNQSSPSRPSALRSNNTPTTPSPTATTTTTTTVGWLPLPPKPRINHIPENTPISPTSPLTPDTLSDAATSASSDGSWTTDDGRNLLHRFLSWFLRETEQQKVRRLRRHRINPDAILGKPKHISCFPFGRISTIFTILCAMAALGLSIGSKQSLRFVKLDTAMFVSAPFVRVRELGLVRMELCFADVVTSINWGIQHTTTTTLVGSTFNENIETNNANTNAETWIGHLQDFDHDDQIIADPNAGDITNDQTPGCISVALESPVINDILWNASRSFLSIAIFFGFVLVVLLMASILWETINLRPVAIGLLFVYFFQSLTFIFFDSDICREYGCKMYWGSFSALLSGILWFLSGISTIRMDMTYRYRRRALARKLLRKWIKRRKLEMAKRRSDPRTATSLSIATDDILSTDVLSSRDDDDSSFDDDQQQQRRCIRSSRQNQLGKMQDTGLSMTMTTTTSSSTEFTNDSGEIDAGFSTTFFESNPPPDSDTAAVPDCTYYDDSEHDQFYGNTSAMTTGTFNSSTNTSSESEVAAGDVEMGQNQ